MHPVRRDCIRLATATRWRRISGGVPSEVEPLRAERVGTDDSTPIGRAAVRRVRERATDIDDVGSFRWDDHIIVIPALTTAVVAALSRWRLRCRQIGKSGGAGFSGKGAED